MSEDDDFKQDKYGNYYLKELSEEEEEDVEVEEIMIKGKKYCTDSKIDGDIYNLDQNGDPDEIVGQFKNGKAIFS